jgi:hypothetical protein
MNLSCGIIIMLGATENAKMAGFLKRPPPPPTIEGCHMIFKKELLLIVHRARNKFDHMVEQCG